MDFTLLLVAGIAVLATFIFGFSALVRGLGIVIEIALGKPEPKRGRR